MPSPKKGDVVWVKEWGGVIGEFISLNENTLTLRFPRHEGWQFGDINPRQFYPVKKEDIKILSPLEVLEKMDKIFAERLDCLGDVLIRGVKEALLRLEI